MTRAAHGHTELGETPPRVVLYSKPGCHLCDVARAVIEAVCVELGESYHDIDITSSEELMSTYGEEIPVTTVDGIEHATWRLDPDRLRQALGRPRAALETRFAPRSE